MLNLSRDVFGLSLAIERLLKCSAVKLLHVVLITGLIVTPAQASGPVTQSQAPFRDKWAVVVGVSRYLNHSLDTHYGAKDASDFARFLVEKGNFAPDHILLLTDEKASSKNITDAIGDRWLPSRAQPDDLVVFFASSHARADEYSPGDGFLFACDTDPDKLYASGVKFGDIIRIFSMRVHCKQAVLFLDGASSDMVTPAGAGQIIVSSNAKAQQAWESRRYANGVFTRQLITALQAGGAKTRLSDAFQTLKQQVEAEVRSDFKVAQTPVMISRGSSAELVLTSAPLQAVSTSQGGEKASLNVQTAKAPPLQQPPIRKQTLETRSSESVKIPAKTQPIVVKELTATPIAPSTNLSVKEDTATPDTPVRDKWALVIGISKFNNPEYNLKFADKDARDFYDFLINVEKFQPDHIKLLLNEEATRANIMSAFGSKWLPSVVEPGDLVVIYISTHGTPADVDRGHRNYIVACDTDAGDLYPTGVNMDEIYARIKEGVQSERVLIVLDTCYSGAGVPGGKGLVRYKNFDLNQVPLGKGHLSISSSSNNQRSWESKSGTNSVFTRHLIDALKASDGKVDVVSAFNKLKGAVQWEVKRDRGEEQVPVLGGNWSGRQLILSVPAQSPRSMKD